MTIKKVRIENHYFVFCVLAALFVFSMFFRVTTAVIAPDLIREFALNAETLGILGGVFYYAFALSQIPLGPMLDRIGPRVVLTIFSLIGAMGAVLFALSKTYSLALVGRSLMGIGMASVAIGSLKVFTLIMPKDKFGSLSGIFVSVGTLGSVMAATPFAYISSILGWRNTLLSAGAATVILGLVNFWALGGIKEKKSDDSSSLAVEETIGIFQSIKLVFGSLAFWQIAAPAFCRYGTFVSLQGLWLGVYLMDVENYSPIQAGNILVMLAIGMIFGSPCAGWLYDRANQYKKKLILLGLSLYCVSLFPLTGIVQVPSPFMYGFISFFIGFFSGFAMLFYAAGKELFPHNLSGTAIAWVNFFLIMGGAFFTQVLGRLIELFPHVGQSYPPKAYHVAFALCMVAMAASIIFYAFSRKQKV